MWFFSRRKREEEKQPAESEVQERLLQAEVKFRIANEDLDKLNKLIEEARRNNDITLKISLAAGADRRMK